MKNVKNVLWGIVLIVIGIILGLNALDITKIDLLFDGWWTLFIIVPCFIGLFNDNDKVGDIVGLIIGGFLLLACQDVLDFGVIWKLIFPLILIVIGLSFIFKNMFSEKIAKKVKKSSEGREYIATFSGGKTNYENENFDGCSVSAIFGAYGIDLRNAKIKEDVVIDATAVFGGIDIFVDDSVNVKVNSTSIFGGVENKSKTKDAKVTVYINATCLFGGVEIK